MLLEAINSVCLTFLATEYLLSHDDASIISYAKSTLKSPQSRPQRYIFAIVASITINLFVHFHDVGAAIAQWTHDKVETLFRIPRILVAISSFLIALYWDCRHKYARNAKQQANPAPWSNLYFGLQVAQSFCKLLPVYPFLAVVISFGFLFVITAFEKLHLPLQVLNGPIYYGTLYGPLMMLYWDVKKQLHDRGNVLPR